MDVTSLYTNIPHKEGITTVCLAYQKFYGEKVPIPTKHLGEMLYPYTQKTCSNFAGATT